MHLSVTHIFAGLIFLALLPQGVIGQMIHVKIHEVEPRAMDQLPAKPVRIERQQDELVLSNRYLSAKASVGRGTLKEITNRVTGEVAEFTGDAVEIGGSVDKSKFKLSDSDPFKVTRAGKSEVVLETRAGAATVRVVYMLAEDDFWLRRSIVVIPDRGRLQIDRIVYGSANCRQGTVRSLELGRFDRPRFTTLSKGEIFAGVEHWFYRVGDDGVFSNDNMDWSSNDAFESETFVVGIYASETDELFPGWTWYKAYLCRAREAVVKQKTWFSWNAGWGQWGIDIDDPAATPYLEMASKLGINGIIFGSGGTGRGIDVYTHLASSNEAGKKNLASLALLKIVGGTLNQGQRRWNDSAAQIQLHDELASHAKAGYQATAFDFFSSPDSYVAHRNVRDYFAAARQQLAYTECHLGMATYGPQFQRFVQVNHPDDIAGFDIAHFSADWATFLAFRDSRRKWQKKFEYLPPENGLYYYLTHYSNWGNPRRYTNPEPQQFLWSVPAYCGIGFNFHDTVGFRECIAASSAFTTCPVFGHLDLKMPGRDVSFARRFLSWLRENSDILQPARVCDETEEWCVVSKLRGGKGLIYLINYQTGDRDFRLSLPADTMIESLRQVYPTLRDIDPSAIDVQVRGESCAIIEVNTALRSLPPSSERRFLVYLSRWEQSDDSWTTRFRMPDARESMKASIDPQLPQRLLSLDEVQDTRPDLLAPISKDGSSEKTSAVKWIGKGKLPEVFRKAYGFGDDGTVETWKIVPWAYADRIWLVYRPATAIPLAAAFPHLTLNGKALPLYPRVDHRFDKVAEWNCPLFFADVTDAIRFDGENALCLSGVEAMPEVYITCAADDSP